MNILVTGAKGMVGTALCNNLKNIRDGKNKTRPVLHIEEIYEYDLDSTPEELDEYCRKADFVFNLAGVNRPENPEDFMKGNFGFASDLLNCLKKHGNKATIMLSSSIQATLAGRFGNSEYGRSKKAGEELFFDYAKETGDDQGRFQDEYWMVDETVQKIEILPHQDTEITFTNVQYGKLKIQKTVEGDGSLAGWQFRVTDAHGAEIEGSPFVSGDAGTIITDNLLPGEYTVEELLPEGSLYQCKSENPQTVAVIQGQTAEVSFFVAKNRKENSHEKRKRPTMNRL